MATCIYELKIGKTKKSFSSQKELDDYLADQLKQFNIIQDPTSKKYTFTTPQQKAILKMQSLQEEYNKIPKVKKQLSDGTFEYLLKFPNSIGASAVIEDLMDETTKFNKDKYFQHIRDTFIQNAVRWAENDKEWKTYQSVVEGYWESLTACGTEVHNLFEAVLNNNLANFKARYLQDTHIKTLSTAFTQFIQDLKVRFGDNAQFYTELPIKSTHLSDLLNEAKYDSINGRMDLFVIDEQGICHIFDFKVSPKDVGYWGDMENDADLWHSIKKQKIEYQLAIYRAILEQHGFTVGKQVVVPVGLTVAETPSSENFKNYKFKVDPDDNAVHLSAVDDMPGWSSSQTLGIKRLAKIRTYLPLHSMLDQINLSKSVVDPMSVMFPSYALNTQVQRAEVKIDMLKKRKWVVQELFPGDVGYDKGRWKVYDRWKKKHSYYKTEEELNEALERLVAYENAHIGNEVAVFAETLMEFINNPNTEQDLNTAFSTLPHNMQDYARRVLGKYLTGNWRLQNNPAFIAAGLFVFVDPTSQNIEIVSLNYNPTHKVVSLSKGTTLLGEKEADSNVDEHTILQATNGNVDLMKVMNIINANFDLFSTYKIQRIASHNIWDSTGAELYNEQLLHNFSALCDAFGIKNNIVNSCFATTAEYTMSTVEQLIGDHYSKVFKKEGLDFNPSDKIYLVELFQTAMHNLTTLGSASQELNSALKTGNFLNTFDDPVVHSYMLLGNALNQLTGTYVYLEEDPAKWLKMSRRGVHTGAYINSIHNAPSLNLQNIGSIQTLALSRIRRAELKFAARHKKVFTDYYEWKGRNRLIGGETRYFKNLFVQKDGEIDPSFILRNPNDPELHQTEKAVIELFCDILAELDPVRQKLRGTDDVRFRQVPLAMASNTSLLHEGDITSIVKTKVNESFNFLRLLPEEEHMRNTTSTSHQFYNRYRIDDNTRLDLISTYGVSKFETHLEKLLLSAINVYSTEKVMNDLLPRMQAVKIMLQYHQEMFGLSYETCLEFIDKYIDLNVHNQAIMDENLQPVYKFLNVMKTISSTAALGFNFRSGLREFLQGTWIHISRNMVKMYGKNMFSLKELTKAWTFVTQESCNDINKLTLLDALNVEYGMVESEGFGVQEKLSSSQSGLLNFQSDTMYIFNRIPDSYHRLGILIAQMMHDGCFEAYSVVDGELKYDFTKDARFSLLSDPNADKTSDLWKEQHSLYMTLLEDFTEEGERHSSGRVLKDGDALPRAYTLKESASLKSFAEFCFGHYDRSTQMLIKHQFLGALWLQFRTFLSAKLEQWILKPGHYNQGAYKTQYFTDGDMKVRVYTFDDMGIPSVEIKRQSELTGNEIWEPHKEWEGRFMEGILYSMLSFGESIWHLDFKEFRELWQNDTKRANFWLFFIDMGVMSALMMLIMALIEEREEAPGPINHLIESAMYQSFSDGPILNIAQAFMGDLNPPAYLQMKNMYRQFTKLLTGNSTAFDFMTNTVGALSDLKYLPTE